MGSPFPRRNCGLEAEPEVPERVVLDLDTTDDHIHGHQEGRFFHGYYVHTAGIAAALRVAMADGRFQPARPCSSSPSAPGSRWRLRSTRGGEESQPAPCTLSVVRASRSAWMRFRLRYAIAAMGG